MTDLFVKIIADDLTGALDSAAPFASRQRPVRLLRADTAIQTHAATEASSGLAGVTISSESRDINRAEGTHRVARALKALDTLEVPSGAVPVHYAKLDSVLRGRPIEETLQKTAHWHSATCLFAPAFPDMGRRTLNGYHQVRDGADWKPAFIHDIRAAFHACGIDAQLRRPGNSDTDEAPCGFYIGDVTQGSDLLDHVRFFRRSGNVAWAGSRGLAEALAGPARRVAMPPISTLMVGTTHPATRAQLEVLHASQESLFDVVDPVPEAESAVVTRERIYQAVGDLMPGRETGLFIVGGDTLASVLAALGKEVVLDCVGEIAPGVPLSIISGGAFDGLPLVSKSGGFGDKYLLASLMEDSREPIA